MSHIGYEDDDYNQYELNHVFSDSLTLYALFQIQNVQTIFSNGETESIGSFHGSYFSIIEHVKFFYESYYFDYQYFYFDDYLSRLYIYEVDIYLKEDHYKVTVILDQTGFETAYFVLKGASLASVWGSDELFVNNPSGYYDFYNITAEVVDDMILYHADYIVNRNLIIYDKAISANFMYTLNHEYIQEYVLQQHLIAYYDDIGVYRLLDLNGTEITTEDLVTRFYYYICIQLVEAENNMMIL